MVPFVTVFSEGVDILVYCVNLIPCCRYEERQACLNGMMTSLQTGLVKLQMSMNKPKLSSTCCLSKKQTVLLKMGGHKRTLKRLVAVSLRLMSSTVNLFVVPEEKYNGQKICHNKRSGGRFL